MMNFPRWKALSIWFAVALAMIFALPNLVNHDRWQSLPLISGLKPMVLGLDLQGGSHVLLEVDRNELEGQLAKQLIADIRQTLREQKITYTGLGRVSKGVSVRITNPEQGDRALEALRRLSQPVSTGLFGSGGSLSKDFDVSRDNDLIVFGITQAGL